jgi:adenylate cyclase
VEIERKWLVPEAPDEVLAAPSDAIDQGYLTIADDGSETRVRHRGDRYWLTTKSGGALVRQEHEVELTAEQFDVLWPATERARVQKVRYVVPTQDGHQIEVDVYGGALSGLIVAEVEFDDPWGAEIFVAPYWFGAEITDDPSYKNQRLALAGRPSPS